MTEHELFEQISLRAVKLYERIGAKPPPARFIASEVQIVHQEIVTLRLQELLEASDADFAHDVGGIHRYLVIGKKPRLTECFLPRFAEV